MGQHCFPTCWPISSWLSFSLQQKRKLRIYISNTFSPSKAEGDSAGTTGTPGGTPAGDKVASWELRVEGKLLDDVSWGRSCLEGRWPMWVENWAQTPGTSGVVLPEGEGSDCAHALKFVWLSQQFSCRWQTVS